MNDRLLLQKYINDGSQQAFGELVRRHQAMVYSIARRRVGRSDLAEDVTQAVFIILARKAKTIRKGQAVSSWLYKATRYASIDALRRERARNSHELKAGAMKLNAQDQDGASPWDELQPTIEQAIDALGERDRDAVIQRYYEQKTLNQIAKRQGVSTATAHRRIDRAVAALQKQLKRRGITMPAAVVGSSLIANAVHAAPAGVTASLQSISFASTSGAVCAGGAMSIAKGTIATMNIAKAKVAAIFTAAGLSLTGAGVAVQQAIASDPQTPPHGYELVWSDEFDGDTLDAKAWHYRADAKEQSVQLPENVSVQDGELVLKLSVLNRPVQGKRFGGAGIVSSRDFGFGYYEVRAKLGDGVDHDNDGKTDEGWHHAFWCMRTIDEIDGEVLSTSPVRNRSVVEIDGFENSSENLSRFRQHLFTWDEDGQRTDKLPGGNSDLVAIDEFDASQWHVYGFEWTAERVRFFVDGQLTHEVEYSAEVNPTHDLNVWLSAISTNANDRHAEASEARYDYFRFYAPAE